MSDNQQEQQALDSPHYCHLLKRWYIDTVREMLAVSEHRLRTPFARMYTIQQLAYATPVPQSVLRRFMRKLVQRS